jgi:hypothetical protein
MNADAEATLLVSCCEHHTDWPTLAQHIVDDFAEVPVGDVATELRCAREAVESFRLDDDPLGVVETIARHRLSQRAAAVALIAASGSEQHGGRSRRD